jgi:hypothetical protein
VSPAPMPAAPSASPAAASRSPPGAAPARCSNRIQARAHYSAAAAVTATPEQYRHRRGRGFLPGVRTDIRPLSQPSPRPWPGQFSCARAAARWIRLKAGMTCGEEARRAKLSPSRYLAIFLQSVYLRLLSTSTRREVCMSSVCRIVPAATWAIDAGGFAPPAPTSPKRYRQPRPTTVFGVSLRCLCHLSSI